MKKLIFLSLLITTSSILPQAFTMPCLSNSNIKWYEQDLKRTQLRENLIEKTALAAGAAVIGLTAYSTYLKSQDPQKNYDATKLALHFLRDGTWSFISTAFGFFTVYSLKTSFDDSHAYLKEQTKVELLRHTLKYYATQLVKPTLTPQLQDYYKAQVVLTCNRLNNELEKLCGFLRFSKSPDAALQDMTSIFYKNLEDALNNPTMDATAVSEIIEDFYFNLGNILYDAGIINEDTNEQIYQNSCNSWACCASGNSVPS